jgi:hypothetical protein
MGMIPREVTPRRIHYLYYIIIIMVKVLSNFDTKSPTKNYAIAVQEFGFDKVIFLRRHKLYFILYTLTPVVVAVLLIALLIISMMNT